MATDANYARGKVSLPGRGMLFGIGVGPGDPELLTLKAINAIHKCDVIAVPAAGKTSASAGKTSASAGKTSAAVRNPAAASADGKPIAAVTAVTAASADTADRIHPAATVVDRAAFAIVERYIGGKELLECRFAMENDMEKRKAARRAAAGDIIRCLDMGKDVGFITLGDPTTYSTYMYVHKIVAAGGYATRIIPGITSYAAAAAELGMALCEDDEPLAIIPAGRRKRNTGAGGAGGADGTTGAGGTGGTTDVGGITDVSDADGTDAFLDFPGTRVLMKSGDNLTRVLRDLKASGYGDRTKIACRVTMDGQRLYGSIDEYERSPETGYFTIAIVK